jgi:hypothetical protein
MKPDLEPINVYLSDRRIAMLAAAVEQLWSAVESRRVPNKIFTAAKSSINLAVCDAADAYRKATSDRDFGVIISAHDLLAAHKAAVRDVAEDRAAFLSLLLPLRTLLQDAKPHIVKRESGPSGGASRAKAGAMTCQCCGRFVQSNTGFVARHGYKRPFDGWQTTSCVGAGFQPFEASRDRLGRLIDELEAEVRHAVRSLAEIEAERLPIVIRVADRSHPLGRDGRRPTKAVEVTRSNWEGVRLAHDLTIPIMSFDDVKKRELSRKSWDLEKLRQATAEQVLRFERWRKTRAWDPAASAWRVIAEEVHDDHN